MREATPSEIRKIILYHYRRAHIGEVESDTIEFQVILEKDGKQLMFGQKYTEGTFHKPKQIYQLLEQGWKLVAVRSCYKWAWTARRYVSPYDGIRDTDQDVYGREFVEDLWLGWYDKVDVIGQRRHEQKVFHNADTDQEKILWGIPKEVEKLFDETEWGMDAKP